MSCNILLVEDEPLARRNITIFLQRASHHVHQAETGEAAIDLISRINSIPSYQISGYLEGSTASTS
jgi:DNA-binding response OmpR family regulator